MNLISKSSFPCGSRFILFIIMLFFSYIFLFQENKSKKITIIQQKMENTLQYLPFFHAASVDQCFGCTKEYRLCRVSMDKYTLRRMSFFPLSPYLEDIQLDKKTSTKAIVWYLLGVKIVAIAKNGIVKICLRITTEKLINDWYKYNLHLYSYVKSSFLLLHGIFYANHIWWCGKLAIRARGNYVRESLSNWNFMGKKCCWHLIGWAVSVENAVIVKWFGRANK